MYLGHFGKVHQALRVVGLGVHVKRVDLVQVRSDVGEGIGRLAAGREGGEGGEGGDSTGDAYDIVCTIWNTMFTYKNVLLTQFSGSILP